MVTKSHKLSALEIIQSKVYTRETIYKQLTIWEFQDDHIVFTNGCFDLIHRGHIDYLAKARDLGKHLIVGINSDASVKRLGKSPSRPLQDENTRALIIASLHFVTGVVIFDEDTPLDLIQFINPSVLVKGADYDANETNPNSKKYIVGSDFIRSKGGEVKTIEFLEGFSTTAIEHKILSEVGSNDNWQSSRRAV
jgi:rfaE bifunctional protein nucleotidyltransferase chain/domain